MTAAPHAVMRVLDDQYLDRPFRVLTWLGALSVVAGGVVAAVTGPLELDKGQLACRLPRAGQWGLAVCDRARLQRGWRSARSHRGGRGRWSQVGIWVTPRSSPGPSWRCPVGGCGVPCSWFSDWESPRSRSAVEILPRARWDGPARFVLLVLAISIPIGVLLAHVRPARKMSIRLRGPRLPVPGESPHTSEARESGGSVLFEFGFTVMSAPANRRETGHSAAASSTTRSNDC